MNCFPLQRASFMIEMLSSNKTTVFPILSLVENLLRKSASKSCSGRANSKIRIQLKTLTGREFSGNDCFVLSPKNRGTLYLLCFFTRLLGLNNWIWLKVVVLHINILFITYLSFMASYNIDYYKKIKAILFIEVLTFDIYNSIHENSHLLVLQLKLLIKGRL